MRVGHRFVLHACYVHLHYDRVTVYLVLFSCVVLPCAMAGPTAVLAEETVPTLEQVLAGVRAAEHRILNLHVEGFLMTLEEKRAGASEWTPSKVRFKGDAWFNGLSN